MAKKRRARSYDIRPKSSRTRKSWKDLSSSGKSYWRSKLDIRGRGERRIRPLDRIETATERARYIQPVYRTPFQKRIIEQTGAVYTPRGPDPDVEARKYKKGKPTYGYDAEEFEKRTSYPKGYSYVTYHLFYTLTGSDANGTPQVETVRGQMYNSPEEANAGWRDEVEEIIHDNSIHGKHKPYIRTIIAVIPQSGDERVAGAVYPEDYHPKERPGTREFQIEEGKRYLREQESKRGQ